MVVVRICVILLLIVGSCSKETPNLESTRDGSEQPNVVVQAVADRPTVMSFSLVTISKFLEKNNAKLNLEFRYGDSSLDPTIVIDEDGSVSIVNGGAIENRLLSFEMQSDRIEGRFSSKLVGDGPAVIDALPQIYRFVILKEDLFDALFVHPLILDGQFFYTERRNVQKDTPGS